MTHFRIGFETHAAALADGAPAESFMDSNEVRARFDNFVAFAARHGRDALGAGPCDLPRVTCARQLPLRLRCQLPRRMARCGWSDLADADGNGKIDPMPD